MILATVSLKDDNGRVAQAAQISIEREGLRVPGKGSDYVATIEGIEAGSHFTKTIRVKGYEGSSLGLVHSALQAWAKGKGAKA